MQNRINKPRVFLSHSSKDKSFIENLAVDLRKCQIEPWLDTEEIRDGKPWLKVIFEDGIPTCDAVLVYLTENSLNSKMVEKELDATLVEELTESGIRILPYVSRAELRSQLRADVRTLQCREWNNLNYNAVLPSVVAEVWRSYMERSINSAILQERNRRLELELELKKIEDKATTSVFSESEDRDFKFIHNNLDRDIEIESTLHQKISRGRIATIGKETFKVNLLTAITYYLDKSYYHFEIDSFVAKLFEVLNKQYSLSQTPGISRDAKRSAIKENLILKLKTYGLLRLTKIERFDRLVNSHEFSEKMYRFNYWLGFNNFSVGKLSFERISFIEIPLKEDKEDSPSKNAEIEYARKVADEVRIQDQRKKWLTTEIGVLAAYKEIEKLYKELTQIVDKSNEEVGAKDSSMRVELGRENENHMTLSCRGLTLSIVWTCKFANTLDDSILSVEGYPTKFDMTNGQKVFMDKDRFYQAEYKIDVDDEMNIVWQRNVGSEKPIFTTDLAKQYFTYLFSSVRSKSNRD